MSNGIVRRIDELGRIVIPKEIRRTMRLREGDEMEILSDGEQLTLKKYSRFENFAAAARTVARMIFDYIDGAEVFIVTEDKLVAVAAKGKARFDGAVPSAALSKIVASRSAVALALQQVGEIFDGVSVADGVLIVEPVSVNGDSVGAVAVCVPSMPDENKIGYIRFAAAMLSAVISE